MIFIILIHMKLNLFKINIEKWVPHGKRFMRISLVIFLCLALTETTHAGFEKQQQSARGVGLGNALTAHSIGVGSLFYNPSLLAATTNRQFMFFYSPLPLGVSEFSTVAAGFVEPFSFGKIGLSVQTSGFDLYREVGVGLSYAHSFYGLNAGITINYNSLSIEQYGSTGVVSFDLGNSAPITSQIQAGAMVYNLNRPRLGIQKEALPLIFTAGLSYQPIEEIILLADVHQDIHYPMMFRAGVQYSPLEFLHVRIGNTTEPSRFSAGLGLEYSAIEFDYAFQTHSELSDAHSFSIHYRFD